MNYLLIYFGNIFVSFDRYLNNYKMAKRGLLICFVYIFLLMLLLLQLKNSTRYDYEKYSPTPMISSETSVKGDIYEASTLSELEIEFTNISVLKEVMIKG